jgi:5-methylthioadenosine/S-adenosylhomocysteine deaminase
MPAIDADLSIKARWIVPMTARGRVLEDHALVVRDGRILDLLPVADAAERYAATQVVERPAHLLMPGLINAHTHAGLSLTRASVPPVPMFGHTGSGAVRDGVLAAAAEMLQAGITCFADRCGHPDETAHAAVDAGMRAVIGLPVSRPEYLTQGLGVRDEYADHPLISTVFAPDPPNQMSNDAFARIATLADELDAGILVDLHASADEITRSVAAHGSRPIERLWHLGLLTPALTAVHMDHASEADIELAQRTGMAIGLGLSSGLMQGAQSPPLASFIEAGIRLGLGTGGAACRSQDLWTEMKLYALMTSRDPPGGEPHHAPWDALAAATCGAASVLGLEAGMLEPGKWADLCCVDLARPATQPLSDPVRQLVFCGGRDMVSDVWVAGRPLLSAGDLTRLDWTRIAARAAAWGARLQTGR